VKRSFDFRLAGVRAQVENDSHINPRVRALSKTKNTRIWMR
jgi:hypothetical protein